MSCTAKKDPNGTWHIQYRWTDWTGTKKKSQKRGFKTKKEAEEWYAHFMTQQAADPTMTFEDFWEVYKLDMEKRLRKTTMKQKEYIVKDKLLPYFGKTPINEISAPMIRKWQGELLQKGFKPTYLKTINNQLSCMFNYAVNFYDLRSNPCHKAGSMGKSKADERPFWTPEEFQKFSDAIIDKHDAWIGFQILFWTGIRLGELLALRVSDIDFENGTLTVDESYTRLDGEDLITPPKNESSIRVITIHKELQDSRGSLRRKEGGAKFLSIFTRVKEQLTARQVAESYGLKVGRNGMAWKRNSSSITDTDVFQIQRYLEKNYQLTSEKIINKSLHIIASENSYHPIRDRLETLRWDGVERIDNLMVKYLGVDDNFYTREVMHLLMQAAIHRIHKPGCKFEIMVCFVGGQGAGKSTFSRFLTLEDEWFSDDLKRLDDDNIYRKLQGHWFIEMSEMIATASARSIEDIKSFVSRQKETYKIPYETHPEDRLRQCVFVGTSNNMDFLPLDRTGNRRFAPILVHPEKIEKHILEDEKESREYFIQAWAEAMEIYKKTEDHVLKLSKEAESYLTEWQKQFMPEDTKVGTIQAWLDNSQEDYVCSLMIYREAIGRENDEPKQWETREINNIMNTSIEGWQPVSSHRFGKMYGTQRGWRRKTDTKGFTEVTKQMEIPFD